MGPRDGMDPSSSSMVLRPVFGPMPPRSPSPNLAAAFRLRICGIPPNSSGLLYASVGFSRDVLRAKHPVLVGVCGHMVY
jgi:hypothetical protein